jgi:hypothetical protein
MTIADVLFDAEVEIKKVLFNAEEQIKDCVARDMITNAVTLASSSAVPSLWPVLRAMAEMHEDDLPDTAKIIAILRTMAKLRKELDTMPPEMLKELGITKQ